MLGFPSLNQSLKWPRFVEFHDVNENVHQMEYHCMSWQYLKI